MPHYLNFNFHFHFRLCAKSFSCLLLGRRGPHFMTPGGGHSIAKTLYCKKVIGHVAVLVVC
jgi:hypothetical protein